MQQLQQTGRVFWLTGLSGAGKTTVGRQLQLSRRSQGYETLLLDGDVLRHIFGNRHGYSREDRLELARMYSRLCKELAAQGIDVICATISMFHEIHQWNRENIGGSYVEIYLKVPHEERASRDPKGFYAGNTSELAGVDQGIEEPLAPDLLIENHGKMTPEHAVNTILQHIAEHNK